MRRNAGAFSQIFRLEEDLRSFVELGHVRIKIMKEISMKVFIEISFGFDLALTQ